MADDGVTTKVTVIGQDVPAPSALQDEEETLLRSLFRKAGVLDPPFDPKNLTRIWENSSALNQNVEAYMVNIDGMGHRFEPVFDHIPLIIS